MTQPKSPRDLGPVLNFSDVQLALHAEVTAFDIEQAKTLWRDNAPKPLKNLLDAQPEV